MTSPEAGGIHRKLFLGHQERLLAALGVAREVIDHPGVKGAAVEAHWIEMLRKFLPARYQVDRAFVIDCHGSVSDQIDLVIFDRQYSPLLFHDDQALYVAAESVYAVLEVKQELSKETIHYAAQKVRSVRRLERTSAPIVHAGGTFEPRVPFEIAAGVVCLESAWSPPAGQSFQKALLTLDRDSRLNFGCALRHFGFAVTYGSDEPDLFVSEAGVALVFFVVRLFACLQQLGTGGCPESR